MSLNILNVIPHINIGIWVNTIEVAYPGTCFMFQVFYTVYCILLVRPANSLISVTQVKKHLDLP